MMKSVSVLFFSFALAAQANPRRGYTSGAAHASVGHAGGGSAGHGHASSSKGKNAAPTTYVSKIPVTTYEETCPPGYDADGAQCVKTTQTRAMDKCPEGSIMSSTSSSSGHHGKKGGVSQTVCRIVSSAPVETSCPAGYEMQNNVCVQEEIMPEDEECPSGYSLVNGECLQESSFAPRHVCPPGTVQSTKNKIVECIHSEVENPTHSCPDGFELIGKDCVRKVAASPLSQCPRGYEENDMGECTKTHESHPRTKCAEGFTKHGDKCQKTTTEEAEMVCEEGFELMGTTCLQKLGANYLKTCPHGFDETAEGECVASSSYPLKRNCPTGTKTHHGYGGKHGKGHHGEMECSRVVVEQAQMECPPGYEMQGTICVMEETLPEDEKCPQGYERSGDDCVKVDIAEMHSRCPVGTTRDGEACWTSESAPLQFGCPEGTEERNGKCVTDETAPKQLECPHGYTQSTQTANDGGELCEKCDSHASHKSTSACSYVPAHMKCPVGFTKDIQGGSKTDCFKVNYHQQITFCPPGFEAIGSAFSSTGGKWGHHNKGGVSQQQCIKKTMQELEWTCPAGYTQSADGSCTREHRSLVQRSCQTGYSKHHHGGRHHSAGVCSKMSTATASPICPPDYQLNGQSCIRTTVEPVEETCPPHTERHGDECVSVRTASMVETCPEGFVKSSKGETDCTKKNIKSPSPICPDGYEEKFGKCLMTEEEDYIHECLKGDLIDGKCVQTTTAEAEMVCPDDFTKDFTTDEYTCTKTTTEKPEINCPEGYAMFGAACRRQTPVEPGLECSGGARLSEDGNSCLLVKTSDIRRKCPTGYSKHHHGHHDSSSTCSKISNVPVESFCPPGFTMSTTGTSGHGGHGRFRGSTGVAEICTATEMVEPILYCAVGELMNDMCISHSMAPMEKVAHTTYEKKTKEYYNAPAVTSTKSGNHHHL